MPERVSHEDVAAYALGTLDEAERAAFEAHLEDCAACREELALLAPMASALRGAAPPDAAPAGLRARTLEAVERAAAPAPAVPLPRAEPSRRRRPRRPGRRGAALALAGVAAAALLALVLVLGGGQEREPEVRAELVVPGARGAAGEIEVTNTGIGRVVELHTDALPELDNERAFYEVWFVGPGDRPRSPNRVSAGTFHPDTSGRSDVQLAAAAVPADYPTIAITREPRDGDPRATGPEVLRTPG